MYKVEKREIEASISTMTLSEIFYILARYMNTEFANTVLKYIRINLKRTPVTDKIAEKGGQLKFQYASNGMPLADAIIAATAQEEKAVLISGEKHFKKIKEIEAQTPKEFLQRSQ